MKASKEVSGNPNGHFEQKLTFCALQLGRAPYSGQNGQVLATRALKSREIKKKSKQKKKHLGKGLK